MNSNTFIINYPTQRSLKFDDKAQIRLANQTTKTSSFFPNKDKVTDNAKSSLVYQYKCSRCGGCYTGETIRHLSTRMNEHLTGRPMPTEVTTRATTQGLHHRPKNCPHKNW